jgi:flagellar biosynthesis/type III secretory pathway chaperone
LNTAIKEKNVDKIQRLTEQFDTLIGQVEVKEVRRLEVCDSITSAYKPENRHMNLLNIITLIHEKERKPFTEIRAALKKKIAELAKINKSNQLLLNESLTAIGRNFELLAESQAIPAGYKQTGAMAKQLMRKNIVNHLV